MRLDAADQCSLMEYSRELNMPFGAVLQGYIMEAVLDLVSKSSYGKNLWLTDPAQFCRKVYEQKQAGLIVYYYIENSKKRIEESSIPGQKLSEQLLQVMLNEVFPEVNSWKIKWRVEKSRIYQNTVCIQVIGDWESFSVPIELRIIRVVDEYRIPRRISIDSFIDNKYKIVFFTYSPEDLIADEMIEIISNLELISDMKPYYTVNNILKENTISGRYILSVLKEYSKKELSFCKNKRIEQLKSYKNYPYMRKRWDRYRKQHERSKEPWNLVMDRILNFIEPIWNALINNEVFLDDWMPELGRFLG